jgi:hypothetical protein
MKKYLRLFAALERIFGKGYVSRLMGKQSNVITLPDKQARKFLDTELNIMEASEGAVKKGVQDLDNLISDTKRLSTLNDQELLTITNNAERLAVKVNPPAPPPAPTAKIIPFTNKPDPEDFATGGRVGMAGGGILKLAMKFFNDNNPVSAYKKYLKYVKETAQKDPAKLAPEVGGIVVGSELIHRGLRRKLKEVKEKNNENNSENFETDNRTEKAGGGVSQGLDYLTGVERRGYANGTLLDRYKELLNEIENPESATSAQAVPYYPTTATGGGNDPEQFDPIKSSIQQQLTPVGPLDHLVNSYLQVPGILSTAIAMGKDYMGLTDAQKDAYSEYGLGYGNTGIKDVFGYNVFSAMDNWATPGSASYNAHKASGKTDQQIAEMRDRVMSAPTKADMRAQQQQYGIDQTQRQQDYFDLTNQGLMGIGLNPGAYAAHSLAALGPAYDDFSYTSPFGGSYGGFGRPQAGDLSYTDYSDKDIGPMGPQAGDLSYTDYSDADIGPAEVDRGGDGETEWANGGRVGYSMGTLIKRTLLTAETLSELKPEYLKKLRRLEGYLGSINMDSKGGEQAVKKTMDKINTLKQEYKLLEKDLSEKKQLNEFDITNRTNNAKGGLNYLMGL